MRSIGHQSQSGNSLIIRATSNYTTMSSEDNEQMMEEAPTVGEEEFDEAPAFVAAGEAVEVQVDEDAPMEDDEDDNENADDNQEQSKKDVEDMARFKIESHTGPVYGVSCHFDKATQKVTLVTGGGDDRAFLHHLQGPAPAAHAMDHAHTDSVSAVALNLDYVSDDLTKTPRLAAVGAYDGGTIESL